MGFYHDQFVAPIPFREGVQSSTEAGDLASVISSRLQLRDSVGLPPTSPFQLRASGPGSTSIGLWCFRTI